MPARLADGLTSLVKNVYEIKRSKMFKTLLQKQMVNDQQTVKNRDEKALS